MNLFLASTSPRRSEILRLLNIPFQTVAPDFEENLSLPLPPEIMARLFSEQKAKSVAAKFPEHVILSGDIVIACAGEMIGKPKDKKDAKRILQKLSGKKHQIFSAATILPPLETVLETVTVTMRPYTKAEIDAYLKLSEYKDKAGAYSMQGAGSRLIEQIEGDYLAAVGLPLKAVVKHLPF